MPILNVNAAASTKIISTSKCRYHLSPKSFGDRRSRSLSTTSIVLVKLRVGLGTSPKVFASRSPIERVKKDGKAPKDKRYKTKRPSDEGDNLADRSMEADNLLSDNSSDTFNSKLASSGSSPTPSRSSVLQACVVTSGLMVALGMVIRQGAHYASAGGWPIVDPSNEVSFDFQVSQLGLIVVLVALISLCRSLLLEIWPDFAESSEAANEQVLGSLQPLDYLVVAFLPGISEEILFRGALLPLFGIKWESALAVGAAFGALHLGSGRRYSFAIWATFVGFAYGIATIFSSSLIVPIAAHALNNLVGGILWRYSSTSGKQ